MSVCFYETNSNSSWLTKARCDPYPCLKELHVAINSMLFNFTMTCKKIIIMHALDLGKFNILLIPSNSFKMSTKVILLLSSCARSSTMLCNIANSANIEVGKLFLCIKLIILTISKCCDFRRSGYKIDYNNN